jgi:hypothetical protein
MLQRSILVALILICAQNVDARAISIRATPNVARVLADTAAYINGRKAIVNDELDRSGSCSEKNEIGCRQTIRGVTQVNLRPIYNGEPGRSYFSMPAPMYEATGSATGTLQIDPRDIQQLGPGTIQLDPTRIQSGPTIQPERR